MEYSYPQQTTSTGEGIAKGAVSGAAMGGTIGSIIPGVGTVLGAGAGALIGGAIGGIGQNRRNKAQKEAQAKLDEALKNRPVYKRQAEWDENVKQAKGVQAMYEPLTKTNTLPGQAYMQNRIDANAANTVTQGVATGVSNPSQLVQLLSSANKTQQDAQVDLSIAGAENRQANIGNYANATQSVIKSNADLAREKDVEWDTNTQQPWLASVGMAKDTFNDSVSRNREKSDQETAFALQSLTSAIGGLKGMGGKLKGANKGMQSPVNSPEMDAVNATNQGVDMSWQQRGRGFTKR